MANGKDYATCFGLSFDMQTIHYNFVRKHRGLKMADGSFLTPAEMAGLDRDLGRDKWIGLIKKATQKKRIDHE